MNTLEKKRKIADLLYFVKILRGFTENREILESLNFDVSMYSKRNPNLFNLPHVNSNIVLNSSLCRTCNLYNAVQSECDLFMDCLSVFKATLHTSSKE